MGEIADALRKARRDSTCSDRPLLTPLEAPEPRIEAVPQGPERREDAAPPVAVVIPTREGPNAEVARQLALRLRSALERIQASTLAVVSALPGEGKTTVACDLALALASLSSERSTALVDLDLRRSGLSRLLGVQPRRGFEAVLHGKATLDEVRIPIERPQLDVYPAARLLRDAHESMALPAFAQTIAELRRRYALIVFDTPPTLLVPDTNLILRHVDACLPIARAGHTRARHFRHLIENLPQRQIIGSLLNEVRNSAVPYHDEYYTAREDGELEESSPVRS